MSRTSDTSKLFQTDAQHALASYRDAKTRLYEKAGQPIRLGSKPLRVVVRSSAQRDAAEAEAWVAESGFVIRRLGLETGKTFQLYRGHLGPVTSLAFYTVPGSNRELLISGSWDKTARVWDIKTKQLLSTTVAHVDFVKAVLVLPSLRLLVSGSSDRDLRLWDLTPFDTWDFDGVDSRAQADPAQSNTDSTDLPTEEPRVGAAPPAARAHAPLPLLSVLKGHTRPIERLSSYAITTTSPPTQAEESGAATGSHAIVSADSMGAMKTWEINRAGNSGDVTAELRCEWRPHEIGVYDLSVSVDDGDEGEMWTVSADSSLLLSTFSPSKPSNPPNPTLRIAHPTALKSLLHLPDLGHVLTGAADEAVRGFSLSSADLDTASSKAASAWDGLPVAADSKLPGMISRVEGHSHEVTDLHAYVHRSSFEGGKRELWVVSGSVDGTLRRWRWGEVLDPPPPPVMTVEEAEEKEKEGMMTAEEEAELDALMAEE